MTFDQHLTVAQGYLELGMFLDANEELEKVAPELRVQPEVLALRAAILRELQRWELLETVTRQLVRLAPTNARWHTEWAEATRYTDSVQGAKRILLESVERLPESAVIHYNLACYECLLGEREVAKARLQHAFKLDEKLRLHALDDPDLQGVWDVD